MNRKKLLGMIGTILIFLLAIGFIFPLVWMIVSSLKTEAGIYQDMGTWRSFIPSTNVADWFIAYREVLARFNIFRYVGNSLIYAGSVTILSIAVNSLAGYAFAKYNFKGKKVLFALMIALLVIPVETIMISKFAVIQKIGLLNTRLAVILPIVASPLYIYMFNNFFKAIPEDNNRD